MSKPTINDIARYTKVSRSTVSNILNNKGAHSYITKQRVWDAVKQLDYKRNSLAAYMKTGRSMSLGVILSDLSNTMFLSLIKGIEKVAEQHAFNVLLSNSAHQIEREKRHIQSLSERQIDGLIISVCDETASHLEQLQTRFPVVYVNRQPQLPLGDVVMTDNYHGCYEAVQYLLNLGHVKIGIIGCASQYVTGRDRYRAYIDAMNAANAPVEEEWVCSSMLRGYDDAYRAGLDYLRRNQSITALMCVGYASCAGIVRAANELGIAIPRDLSVIGYDDSIWCDLLSPRMTMVDQPGLDIGIQAVTTLINRIEGREADAYKIIQMPSRLIIRQSCTQRRQS